MRYFVTIGEREREVALVERLGELRIEVDGAPFELDYQEIDRLGQVIVLHAGRSYAVSIEGDGREVNVTLAGHHYATTLEDERERAAKLAARAARGGGGTVAAVMPGVVIEVLVTEGQEVSEGQPMVILEAMKMQNEIRAAGAGVVRTLHVSAGQAVGAGDALVELEGATGAGDREPA